MSLISPEAMALIDRVETARADFAAEGLSLPAADILIGLGVWRPMALLSQRWLDGPEKPGLATRIALIPDCQRSTYVELEQFCRAYAWAD